MPRFLVKNNHRKNTVAILKVPKRLSASALASKRRANPRKFAGYRMVRAANESTALNRSGYIVAKGVKRARFVSRR